MTEEYKEEIIEEYLRNAVEQSTPDILDELMTEIRDAQMDGEQNEPFVGVETAGSVNRIRVRKRWYKAIAGCAAAVMIFAGALTVFNKGQEEIVAVVDIDVNPSIELSITENNTVAKADALNDDAKALLAGMELKGADINDACGILAESLMDEGYLTNMNNSVLVSVMAEDKTKGNLIEETVSGGLNDYFGQNEVAGAVLSKYVQNDQEIDAFATEKNISHGKAWLIKKLMETNSRHMTEEGLLGLSTQELILLGQERDVETDHSYGTVDTSKYISAEEALQIALGEAGIDGSVAAGQKTEFDCDEGIIVYEVEFVSEGYEYEYDIDAETGRIVESEAEPEDDDADDADDDNDADDADDDNDAEDEDDADDSDDDD